MTTIRLPLQGAPAQVEQALRYGDVMLYGAVDPTRDGASQDRAAAWSLETASVLTVADGAGGHAAGGEAAELAVSAVGEALRQGDDPMAVRHAVLDAFELANRRVREMGSGAATTLAVAVIKERRLRAFHVGDSSILVVGGRGAIRLQTVAHSPVGYAVEAGVLSSDAALLHEDRHFVSNILGNEDMRVEVQVPISLRPRDTVVLASDGVFDNLSVDEVAQLVRKGSLENAAKGLAAACHARMSAAEPGQPHKPDDATFILFRPSS